MTYYRIQATDRPDILNPENQYSHSWNPGEDVRHGISVCDSREELAAYIASSSICFTDEWELLEVKGYRADEQDADAHMGVTLIIPTEIVSRESIGDGFSEEIIAAYDALEA